ncbi:carbohydrate binding domain-containing protein [Pedobacter sp. L105]|uniref:carbohydrate binding domain-containing protein n=1 Tax=Pedobacter sp. L105 TaxID=1641871 RepID=UPI00131E80EB|nr:FN3 associated domain-containing protein [Pedobacter sp. L105]
MKKIIPCLIFLFFTAILHAQTKPSVSNFKIFSRYNYYLPKDEGAVIAVLPDSIQPVDCQFTLTYEGKQLKAAFEHNSHQIKAVLNIQAMPFGTLPLTYRLLHGKQLLASGTVNLIKREYRSNATQIDLLTGGLIADGLPFLPFGFYCGPVGDLPEREVVHGFNMVGPYQDNLPSSYASRKKYMDRCAQLGVKVQYGVNSLVGSGHNGEKGLDKSDQEKLALLKQEVLAFRDHPALLSWYINDEPDGQGRPPKVLEEAYQLIHELDPYHPVSIVFMMPSKAADFRNTMDIAMTDPYPIPGPADKIMEDLKQYNEAYRYEKSVWLVPQAFGGQEMWPREPTGQEMRLMTYMGLISGVKGIQYYVHAAGNLNPQSVSAWSACSDVAVETAQMTSFLLSGDEAPAIKTNDPKILTRTFLYKGNLLIIAVNNENKPKLFTLDVAVKDSSLNHQAELWFENRTVPFEKGHINDIIDAYGTRVYLVRSSITNALLPENNLTLNPSFEKIVSPGLAIGANVTVTSEQKSDPGATFFTDPTQHKEGLFSLRLITPTDSGGKKIRLLPLVMSKGNSYTVSVWAKAKEQDKLPSFRLAMDAMQQDHTFPLTREWKKYTFTYRAGTSSTTSILSLELLQHGTAWFDLLEVSPDPVITYHINPDYTAAVSLSSSTSTAVLRYALDKEPDQQSSVYKQPIQVKEASTFYAALFEGNKVIAASKSFIPVNKALGKPVSFTSTYNTQYAASGAGSLTDGVMGTTAFKDGKWLGFLAKDLEVVLDMLAPSSLSSVSASFLCDPNSGIFLPEEMEVYTSPDGITYSLAGNLKNQKGSVRGEPYLQQFSVPLQKNPVRYIKVTAKNIGLIPDGYLFKGSSTWMFADEILVQ